MILKPLEIFVQIEPTEETKQVWNVREKMNASSFL